MQQTYGLGQEVALAAPIAVGEPHHNVSCPCVAELHQPRRRFMRTTGYRNLVHIEAMARANLHRDLLLGQHAVAERSGCTHRDLTGAGQFGKPCRPDGDRAGWDE